MDISEAITKRKSIRAYQNEPVPNSDIERIVEAGRWAPNIGEFQISVVRSTEIKQKINDLTHYAMLHSSIELLRQRASLPGYQPLYGAPLLILMSAPIDAPYSTINTALAAENMLLQATGLGLGSCFLVSPTLALNGEQNSDTAKASGIPDNHKLQCALVIGYTADESKFAIGLREKKGTVTYID